MDQVFADAVPFDEAVAYVNQHKTELTDRDRGMLYGLYKRATGTNPPSRMSEPKTEKDILQVMRWTFWNRYASISPEEAKKHYGLHVKHLKDRLEGQNS